MEYRADRPIIGHVRKEVKQDLPTQVLLKTCLGLSIQIIGIMEYRADHLIIGHVRKEFKQDLPKQVLLKTWLGLLIQIIEIMEYRADHQIQGLDGPELKPDRQIINGLRELRLDHRIQEHALLV
jgi:hypothetical protein